MRPPRSGLSPDHRSSFRHLGRCVRSSRPENSSPHEGHPRITGGRPPPRVLRSDCMMRAASLPALFLRAIGSPELCHILRYKCKFRLDTNNAVCDNTAMDRFSEQPTADLAPNVRLVFPLLRGVPSLHAECPHCPQCGGQDLRIVPYDYGTCSQTGYRDAGERWECRTCGAIGDGGGPGHSAGGASASTPRWHERREIWR